MRIIILLFISFSLYSQDTIYFQDYTNAIEFSDSINNPNGYPRQNTITFQTPQYDTVNSLYYHIINKVSEKGLNESDSLWIPFLDLNIGDTIEYDSVLYKVIQKHYSSVGWEPTIAISLFVVISTDSTWTARVEYTVDDTIWYSDISYKCLQSHTSQVGWEPPNVLSLWEAIPIISSGCDDAEEWDSSDHWTSYTIGDLRTNNGSLWEVINVSFSYYEPSSTNGVYGWEFVEVCQ